MPNAARPVGGNEGGRCFSVRDLWKTYGDSPVLQGAEAAFPFGAVSAVVGANGAGKSTLFKILAGEVAPDRGGFAIDGRMVDLRSPRSASQAGIRFMHQFPELIADAQVWEHLSAGSFEGRRWLLDRRGGMEAARRALARFDVAIDPSATIAELDQDSRQLVEICRAFNGDPEIVLLDEPTVGLTAPRRAQLYDWMRLYAQKPAAVVVISHDHKGLLGIADWVFQLTEGKVAGPVPSAEAIELLERTKAEIPPPPTLRMPRTGGAVFPIPGGDPGARWSFRDIEYAGQHHAGLSIGAGMIVGLTGPATSWSGQLLRMSVGLAERGSCRLFHDEAPASPDITALIRHHVAYISRERTAEWGFAGLRLDLNIMLTRWFTEGRFRVDWSTDFGPPRATLEQFRVLPADPDQIFGVLSGGNQQKLVIGRHLLSRPRLLLVDEPFSGIDQATRMYLGSLFRRYVETEKATIVVHSQEDDDLAKYCDVVVEIT